MKCGNAIFLSYFPVGLSAGRPSFLGDFAKLRKVTLSFVMSVRPHGTTRLSLDGFS